MAARMDQTLITEKILDLALEIMSLLTGEAFAAVRSGELAAILVPPHGFALCETINKLKILEATRKMAELLTGELPIRCQDVAVYLSMEERQYLEEHEELYKAAMMEDLRTFSFVTKEASSPETEEILNFTAEIIHLLSAEDVMKANRRAARCDNQRRSLRASARQRSNLSAIPMPSTLCMEINLRKILEVTNKMTELLTGEVPFRCQDVAVYLSMEERQYLEEHEELYKVAMMEDQPPLPSPDGRWRNSARGAVSSSDDGSEGPASVGGDYVTSCRKDPDALKRFKCSECNKSFRFNSGLAVHQRTHTDQRPYQCRECGKRFKQPPHLRRHERQHTGEQPYSCPECGKCFAHKDILQEHLCVHTGKWRFHCPVCGKGFIRKSRLDGHFVCHQEGPKNLPKKGTPVSCPECGKTYSHKASLVKHQRVHSGQLPFECSECGKGYKRKDHLIKHMRTHTNERPYVCPECGKCFKQRFCLTAHLRLHRERAFSCADCGKVFSEKVKLLLHQAEHSGESGLPCYQCGRFYATQVQLDVHRKVHTSNRKFKCYICKKSFQSEQDLVKHRRVHTGEKPFSCSQCGRGFSQHGSLRRHQKVHESD